MAIIFAVCILTIFKSGLIYIFFIALSFYFYGKRIPVINHNISRTEYELLHNYLLAIHNVESLSRLLNTLAIQVEEIIISHISIIH